LPKYHNSGPGFLFEAGLQEAVMARKTSRERAWIKVTGMCTFLLISTAGWASQETDGENRGCVFARNLQHPDNVGLYERVVRKARVFADEMDDDIESMYDAVAGVRFRQEDRGKVDGMSCGCLACHDGITAPGVDPRFSAPGTGNRMMKLSGKHPIGTDYSSYSHRKFDLKGRDELNPDLIMMADRISCVTCHDPRNPEPFHMALNSTGADLCFHCHNV